MLHIVPMISQNDLRAALARHNGNIDALLRALAEVFVDAFNRHAGETLHPRRDCHVTYPIIRPDLAADLVLLAVVEWTAERAEHSTAIQSDIERTIAGWYGGQMEVHIVQINQPSVED